jgi:hypothetical protein
VLPSDKTESGFEPGALQRIWKDYTCRDVTRLFSWESQTESCCLGQQSAPGSPVQWHTGRCESSQALAAHGNLCQCSTASRQLPWPALCQHLVRYVNTACSGDCSQPASFVSLFHSANMSPHIFVMIQLSLPFWVSFNKNFYFLLFLYVVSMETSTHLQMTLFVHLILSKQETNFPSMGLICHLPSKLLT